MLHNGEYPILEGNRRLELRSFTDTDMFDYTEKHSVYERVFAQGGYIKQKRVATKTFSISCVWFYDNMQEIIDFFREHQFQQIKVFYKKRFLFVHLESYKIKEKGFYRVSDVELTFTCVNPFWYAQTILAFNKNVAETNGKHFPNNFPHHYGVGNTDSNTLDVPEFESTFILEMQGPVENPVVNILQSGHSNVYEFRINLKDKEMISIDSDKRRAIMIDTDKKETDVFGLRDRTKNIFLPPKPGVIEIDANCNGRLIIYNKDFHTEYGERGVVYGPNIL